MLSAAELGARLEPVYSRWIAVGRIHDYPIGSIA